MKKIICLALIVSIAFFAGNSVMGANAEMPRHSVVIVEHGDTLWSIASKHCSNNQDIRQVIAAIKQENNLHRSVQIYPGQMLRIPRSNENPGFWAAMWNR